MSRDSIEYQLSTLRFQKVSRMNELMLLRGQAFNPRICDIERELYSIELDIKKFRQLLVHQS